MKGNAMRKTAVVILLLLALGQIALAEEFVGSYADAKAQSARLGKPLLVDFFAEW